MKVLKKPLIAFLLIYLVISSILFVRNERNAREFDIGTEQAQGQDVATAPLQLSGEISANLNHNAYQVVGGVPIQITKHVDPVLQRGEPGEWDSVDLLNPSVIKKGNTYYNYYSGYNGEVWQTGLATSVDGVHWSKYEGNPVLKLSDRGLWDDSYIAANGSAIEIDNNVYYYYQGASSTDNKATVGLATSDDWLRFDKESNPVLTTGPDHTWDSMGVADPYVIKHKDFYYMYYLGMDEMSVQRLGVARSRDGVVWEKSVANPILDVGTKGSFDENGLGEPSVFYNAPYFYMVYTGRDAGEKRDIGLAVSLDGVHWKKQNYNGLFADRKSGTWDDSVICDTTFWMDDNASSLWMWYGGGNKPLPAEGLNGAVGLMEISLDQGRDLSEFDPNVLSGQTIVDSQDILKGSYAIEGDPSQKSVWVNKEANIALKQTGSGKLEISGYMPLTAHQESDRSIKDVAITVSINGSSIETNTFKEDTGFTIEIEKDKYEKYMSNDDYIYLDLTCSSSFIPSQNGNSADERELAYIINKISVN
ncbi:hypothetical protein H4Q31_15960 [Cohnella lubricantis]|uniref:Glycosyl hydrolase family 32 N-terminal domain-containing protein n=1 Tax=Cohnella lubricantis TaxID=2163172 RepID=A0A841TEU5_9BACL|nr:hypothetical protein [Cohnella lubricantis]MBB6678786.1 hypothetical protein [Cohnella lubricantis]MBP2117869.1 putative GH43/DUF377 family glycosyl hydrolase [Cohnella lubricantis]